MQKKPTVKRDLKTLLDISNEEISKMTKNQMKAYAKYLSTVAKSRRTRSLKKILATDEPLPQAYKDWGVHDGHAPMKREVTFVDRKGEKHTFSSRQAQSYILADFDISDNMNRNEIYSRLKYIRSFLKTETSTLKGWREYQKTFIGKMEDILQDKIGKRVRIFTDRDKTNAFWRTYRRIEERNPNIIGYTSTQIQAMIYQMFANDLPIDEYNRLDINEITRLAQERVDELYMANAAEEAEYEEFTDPLSIGRNRRNPRNK